MTAPHTNTPRDGLIDTQPEWVAFIRKYEPLSHGVAEEFRADLGRVRAESMRAAFAAHNQRAADREARPAPASVEAMAWQVRTPGGAWRTVPDKLSDEYVADMGYEVRELGVIDRLAATSTPPAEAQPVAARDVLAERSRQVEAEGWTPEHDDEHREGEMAFAAAGYAVAASDHIQAVVHELDAPGEPTMGDAITRPSHAPWPQGWDFKPAPARRLLVKAGALILAEIERLDRAVPQADSGAAGGQGDKP
jgi:hypothetical protein